MLEENNKNKVNPELFKDRPIPELIGETYYAYLDSIERSESIIHLRFDCILKKEAESITINKESILNFPSIVIEIYGDDFFIKDKISKSNIYSLESSWMQITTKVAGSDLQLTQYFNFQLVGNEGILSNYNLDEVKLFKEMDEVSQSKVREIEAATIIEESSETEMNIFFNGLKSRNINYVNVYDVGQGSSNGLVDIENLPSLYFDVGGGCNANKATYPTGFRLCHTSNQEIILSHWDQDHFQTAIFDRQLLNTRWLVPQQKLSNTAFHIAQTLINRRNLFCWNSSMLYKTFSGHCIVKCTGDIKNKNNSGLALFVKYKRGKYVLIPGDASFNKIPHYPTGDIIGLVASHHGSRGSINGMPIAKTPAMLAYSFGRGNTHHHAHMAARSGYINKGWGNGLETQNGSIAMTRNLINLNPPCGGQGNTCSLSVSQKF